MAPAKPLNLDPPDHGQSKARPLTPEEARLVLSGSPYRPAGGIGNSSGPGGTAERNPALVPYLSRGLYPNPGIYYEMYCRDAKLASGTDANENAVRGLDWRMLPPRDAQPEEIVYTEFVTLCLDALGGLVEVAARALDHTIRYGFSVCETVWEIEELSGWWRLEELVTLEPWTVQRWILDERGFMVGATIKDAGGTFFLPRAKMAHFARKFTGRNYEGISAYRPLYYATEAKRRTLTGGERAAARFGDGTTVLRSTDPNANASAQKDAAIDVLTEWADGDQTAIYVPFGMELEFKHGGSVIPDSAGAVAMYDHMIGTVLGDNLQELSQTAYGSRAVGGELRRSFERGAKGVCLGLCQTIQDQIVRPIYERNQWDTRRMAQPYVSGFEDPGWLSMVMTALKDGVIKEQPGDQEKLRRATGLG